MTDSFANDENIHLEVFSAGCQAVERLKLAMRGEVIGITSRGAFLQLDTGRIIFLTTDRWRGPLTVNLDRKLKGGTNFNQGAIFDIKFPRLRSRGLLIKLSADVEFWKPHAISKLRPETPLSNSRCQDLCWALGEHIQHSTFGQVLSIAGQKNVAVSKKKVEILPILEISSAKEFWKKETFSHFLGQGDGLTPAGDDFIIGCLLVGCYLARDIRNYKKLLDEAWKKTTALSASLMECAAEGSADERLMHALEYLLTGRGEVEEINEELFSYGSSSGFETLAGMVCALFLFER